MTIRSGARRIIRLAQHTADRVRWSRYYRPSGLDSDRGTHMLEAAAWLCRAQDAGEDRGVSYGASFGGGFDASYPETTGYIIPTFLSLEGFAGDHTYRRRAVEAAHWEVDIQMTTGAVMAGKVNSAPKPAIFNTGQVLIGWASLGRVHNDTRIQQAAQAASRWMMSMQEPDGRWVRGNSPHANPQTTVYNVKAAWGMCEAGVLWNWPDVVDSAARNAEFSLSRQLPNGWFQDCCLDDRDRPLLHTLAYSMQGLLGIGLLLDRDEFVHAARRTADALIDVMSPDGFLPGRFRADWSPAVEWCCLTGSAQASNVWSDLYRICGDEKYRRARDLVNGYLVARHDISNPNPAIRGGIPGSWPTSGGYGRFKILNWATKFFVDALLAERDYPRPHGYFDRLASSAGRA